MINNQLHILAANGKRRFACSSVALLGYIVNDREEVLLLAHPQGEGGWKVVSGALEAGETTLEKALRETREEAGEKVRVRPLGTVYAQTFHYDENAAYVVSLGYLTACEGGAVESDDDMAGSAHRWWRVEGLENEDVYLIVPGQKRLIGRAVEWYRLWEDQRVQLQPELPQTAAKPPALHRRHMRATQPVVPGN